MKKTLAAFAILGALSLGACNWPSGTSISATQVQQAAQTACAFLPTASTIAGIITSNPNLTTAEQVAAAICSAIQAAGQTTTTPGVTLGDSQVATYTSPNGQTVPVVGHFVTK